MSNTALSIFGVENSFYVVFSSLVAAIGLLSNSKESVIGSMLIAPLFVPIINANKNVLNGGKTMNNVYIFIVSCIVAMFIGYVSANVAKRIGIYEETDEMKSRTTWNATFSSKVHNYLIPLIVGIILAISVTNNDVAAVIGSGIAISILPPIVNAGIYYDDNTQESKDKAFTSLELGLVNTIVATISYTLVVQYFM